MRHARQTVLSAALLLVAGASVGCSSFGDSSHHAGDIGALRADPTPAMHTLGERAHDRENGWVSVRDQNLRMLSDDWDRLWMIDRPSRASKYPQTR